MLTHPNLDYSFDLNVLETEANGYELAVHIRHNDDEIGLLIAVMAHIDDLWEVADQYDSTTCDTASALQKLRASIEDEYNVFIDNGIIINRIDVNKEHRGQQLALYAIERLTRFLSLNDGNLIALVPFPTEDIENTTPEKAERLGAYYAKVGFSPIGTVAIDDGIYPIYGFPTGYERVSVLDNAA
jgi:hypothetical protein